MSTGGGGAWAIAAAMTASISADVGVFLPDEVDDSPSRGVKVRRDGYPLKTPSVPGSDKRRLEQAAKLTTS